MTTYAGSILAVAILSWMASWLAPRFGAICSRGTGLKVAAYAGTAAWVAGGFALLPLLAPLRILGLYSLYLLHMGLRSLTGVTEERAVGYTAAVVVATGILLAVASVITSTGPP